MRQHEMYLDIILAGAGMWLEAQGMYERFTDRARQIMALAQEQARTRGHDRIGPEHLLLGLIAEGESVATQVLESLGVSLETVRQRAEQALAPGGKRPSGHIPFTPDVKRVLQLSLREALQLGHNYIGTEHLLLGLIRGEGIAGRLLAEVGADLARSRHRVLQLLRGYQAAQDRPAARRQPCPAGGSSRRALLSDLLAQVESMNVRLAAVERRMGPGADTSEIDQRIAKVRGDKETAIDTEDYEKAAALRNAERILRAEKAALVAERAKAAPDLPSLAEGIRRLSDEVSRMDVLLRQHGITPQGGAA